MSEANTNLHCSFCGKHQTEVKKLIEGPSAYICDECVALCSSILDGETGDEAGDEPSEEKVFDGVPTPREIKEFLDQYVIGQDAAKEVLAVAVRNHYKRINTGGEFDGVEVEKSNILLIGPSGSGKTLLAQTIARMLDVPFASADATSLTEAGYVGEDVDSIITRLAQASGYDIAQAERGIVFIDEIDKKKATGGTSASRDVSGEGVQQALLKLLEGTDVYIPPQGARKNGASELLKVNTRDILFILGGAFVGLEKIVEKSISADQSMGFGAKSVGPSKRPLSDLLSRVDPEHLIKFGLIPEFVGRVPVITALDDLNEAQLVQILTKPRNALVKQFTKLFKLEGVELEFEPAALTAVANAARKRKTGGRALRSILETRLTKVQFDLPDLRKKGVSKVVVTEATINTGEMPRIETSPTPPPLPPSSAAGQS